MSDPFRPPPSWLPAWTAGGWWTEATTPERNAGHRAWWAALSAPLRDLFLRHPPGEVVELRWDCLPRSIDGDALAPWTTRHGIVTGYLDPTSDMPPWTTRHGIVTGIGYLDTGYLDTGIGYLDPTLDMRELGAPPEGALVLLESPDPAGAAQGVVFEREVARAVGWLQGYDPAAARANLLS